MSVAGPLTKDAIRDRMRTLRRAVKPARRELVSRQLCERLLLKTLGAKRVCCYRALKTEIDLAEFIARSPAEIVFPEKVGDGYQVESPETVDVWICPGLAFTRAGDRVGFGGGWYDRFLAAAKPTARKLGVAYRFQLVDELPCAAHDIRLDEMVVEGVSLDYERGEGPLVMGIDEAGRGPLVGGVYAAAVSVPLDRAAELAANEWRAINDSKQLSEKKRFQLAEVIKATAGCTWAIASASPQEIDALNILKATHLAMRRAAESLAGQLAAGTVPMAAGTVPKILVDGLAVPTLPYPAKNVIKGDAQSLFIAAASILAKTARDEDCFRLEREYPGYGFAKHKGYPTPEHLAALAKLGPCPEHRRSFGPVSQPEFKWTGA